MKFGFAQEIKFPTDVLRDVEVSGGDPLGESLKVGFKAQRALSS